MATFCPEIEQIKDPSTKQAIARKILEGLRDWFEVAERGRESSCQARLFCIQKGIF